ncbi:precorrin-4 C(11)-methyltransferase [Alkaliphilus peptidifermentans]|uniref:Cobalt-precorrin 4 C11-methyltransferase n=1 Tax=Alkaliphilus peptidifermentans DSM 18978 TaxID=1120976 RepID=A0A1G5AQF4_9FIRM|nr:precorrin-4 C(11)-methyltransferase [Alkaliphilus peptidifermentans]SCX80117.1 cobalt-precorrin 4 C11-methyltransferase [Alkaliphilus peptidifermentans DSM 18978]
MTKVYFIGAGPGDPKLITLKGHEVIKRADVIIYAGSLVNPEVIAHGKSSAAVYNSASMTLKEVLEVMKVAVEEGLIVARVHTGDPSIYGAIREQMDALEALSISYEVIPGVSSFVASAAALKKELTLPEVSQTVILTRMEGRTAVPAEESLRSLAKHQATMAIFLSVHMIEEVVAELASAYSKDTPIAVVQKASWPEEKIIIGTLENIAEKVKEAGVTKTAQILVGNFLGDQYELSKLYDEKFSHQYREGKL